jgi:hypothetical protein
MESGNVVAKAAHQLAAHGEFDFRRVKSAVAPVFQLHNMAFGQRMLGCQLGHRQPSSFSQLLELLAVLGGPDEFCHGIS